MYIYKFHRKSLLSRYIFFQAAASNSIFEFELRIPADHIRYLPAFKPVSNPYASTAALHRAFDMLQQTKQS